MADKKNVRLECSECKHINYLTRRNPKTTPEKLQQKNIVNIVVKPQFTKKLKLNKMLQTSYQIKYQYVVNTLKLLNTDAILFVSDTNRF